MTKIRVEIEFDGPYGIDKSDKDWLCPENIAIILNKYTGGKNFKVKEVRMTYEQLQAEYPHYFENITGMGYGHDDETGETFINVGTDKRLKVVLDKDSFIIEAYEGKWIDNEEKGIHWKRGKQVV